MEYEFIVASADWHLAKRTPISRIDKLYFQHGLSKVVQLVSIANEYDAPLLVGGDIYDSIDATPYMINSLTSALRACENGVYAVAGQHDQDHRLLNKNCPYISLIEANVIQHMNHRPQNNIFGLSYGETKLPSPASSNAILIAHKTVTKKKPPFFLKDAISSEAMLSLYSKFKIIITGDYHVPFISRMHNRLLVNCGSLMRKSKEQMNYVPSAFVINCKTLEVDRKFLSVLPKEEVFNMTSIQGKEIVKNTSFEGNLDRVIAKLQKEKVKPDYKNIVQALAVDAGITKIERDMLTDIIRIAENGTARKK